MQVIYCLFVQCSASWSPRNDAFVISFCSFQGRGQAEGLGGAAPPGPPLVPLDMVFHVSTSYLYMDVLMVLCIVRPKQVLMM